MVVSNIVNGWRKYIGYDNLPDELKTIALQRSNICLQPCEYLRQNKLFMFIEWVFGMDKVKGYQCGKCKCSISAKVLDELSICPLKKW